MYVTAAADREELFALAEAAEAEALALGTTPQWPRDASALCQRWRLIATTRTAGSELLQQMARQPALGTFRVSQNWKERETDGALRCDNVVSIGRPNGGLLSAWTLLQAGGQSSLTLQHKAKVLQDGTAGQQPLRIAIEEADSIAAAVAAVETRFGAVDLLVNNGGATEVVPANDLDGLTDDLFDRITQINLRGPFAMVRAFRPLLSRGQDAAVVNVSSIAARTGMGSNLAYCAAKAGLDALTIGLAKALAPDIRVFSVSPAGVDTGFVPGRPREKLEAMAKTLPLQRITTPDDVARAIIACATLLTSSTGIIVPVDEGRHL